MCSGQTAVCKFVKQTYKGALISIQSSAFHSHITKCYQSPHLAEGQKSKLTFNLSDRTEVLLKSVIKLGISDGLKVTGINSSSRGGKATFTHTRVIS